MRTCDDCPMPEAIANVEGNVPLYSLVKHAVIETAHAMGDESRLARLRARHEADGALGVFQSALKCAECTVGLCLIIDGRDTQWQVGGGAKLPD